MNKRIVNTKITNGKMMNITTFIKKKMIIGLISSIITGAIGYGIRFILLKYLDYDVFTNLENWKISLTYFCSLASIRFLISEFILYNYFPMGCAEGAVSPCNGTYLNNTPLTNNSSNNSNIPTATNSTGLNTNPAQGGSDNITNQGYNRLLQRIEKSQSDIRYYREQMLGADQQFKEVLALRGYLEPNLWQEEFINAQSALKDTTRNLSSEQRMLTILNNKLANNDFSTNESPNLNKSTKRKFEK